MYAGLLHCKDLLQRGGSLHGMSAAEAQLDLPASMPNPVLSRPPLTDPHVDWKEGAGNLKPGSTARTIHMPKLHKGHQAVTWRL